MSVGRVIQALGPHITTASLVVSAILLAGGPAASMTNASEPLPLDSDGDGCSDAEELGPDPALGGMRDPTNPYDFYDVPFRDQSISGVDFFSVLGHFNADAGRPSGPPRYDPAFDRSPPPPGGDPWDLQAPDGAISGLDFFAALVQFNHQCSEIPPFYSIANPAFTALPGATAHYGAYSGGGYRIEVPDSWNGDLVLWAHGFRGNSGSLTVDTPPQRSDILAGGYAWASSSYRANGYDPGYGARDTLALKDLFTYLVGPPGRAFLVGGSMGGNVVTLSLEQAPGEYDGALSLCGAVAGVEILDYFSATWPAVGGFLTGVDATIDIETATPAEMIQALQDIHTLLGDPGFYTQAGQQFKSIIVNYTGGPRPFGSEGFDQWYGFTFLLLEEALNARAKNLPTAVAARDVAANDGVGYHIDPGLGLTDQEINAGVQRVQADPAAQAASEFDEFVPMSGQLSAPLMSLHGTGDYFVPIGMDVSYLQKVQAAGKEDLLVQRAYRHAGHCAFTSQDVLEAFDDLVSWVDTGIKPWGDDLSGDLSDIGQ